MLIMAGSFTFPGINFVLSTKNSMPFRPSGAYVFCYSISGGFTPCYILTAFQARKLKNFISCPEGRKVIARGGSPPYALNEARTNNPCSKHTGTGFVHATLKPAYLK
jgi:hypothetical protein